MDNKRRLGQYFTKTNPFNSTPFNEWAEGIEGWEAVEPFCGDGDIMSYLPDFKWSYYDIEPKIEGCVENNSIDNFPKGFDICITNPPYLGKSSAKRRGLEYVYDMPDLYLVSLKEMLKNCTMVCAILPSSFVSNKWLKTYLHSVDLISNKLFNDTDIPVAVCYFDKRRRARRLKIYKDGVFVNDITSRVSRRYPEKVNDIGVEFNTEEGNIGLYCIDGVSGDRIRFCDVKEIAKRKVVVSDRAISKIKLTIEVNDNVINILNNKLEEHRKEFCDITLTSFRGIQKNGDHRKRIPFSLARKIINSIGDKDGFHQK